MRQSFKKETPRVIQQKIMDEETSDSEIERIANRVIEISKPRFGNIEILEESLAVMVASVTNVIGENGEEIIKNFENIVDFTRRMSIMKSGFDEEMVRAKESILQREK